jgi:hypothetical protein
MNGWRHGLPQIPAERIRAEAIREGTRRRERRQQRQRSVVFGGLGVAAVALVLVTGVLSGRDDEDHDDALDMAAATIAVPGETGADDTTAEETTAGTTASGDVAATEVPAETEAASETAEEAQSAETTLLVDYTTVGGPTATLLPSDAVGVAAFTPGGPAASSPTPTEIWEVPLSGPDCGPSNLEVSFRPQSLTLQSPLLHWEVASVVGEAPMQVDGDSARATIGPFSPETLEEGSAHEILVYVTEVDASGAVAVFRSVPVVLRDC